MRASQRLFSEMNAAEANFAIVFDCREGGGRPEPDRHRARKKIPKNR